MKCLKESLHLQNNYHMSMLFVTSSGLMNELIEANTPEVSFSLLLSSKNTLLLWTTVTEDMGCIPGRH